MRQALEEISRASADRCGPIMITTRDSSREATEKGRGCRMFTHVLISEASSLPPFYKVKRGSESSDVTCSKNKISKIGVNQLLESTQHFLLLIHNPRKTTL